jgi:hypothetical protein
VDDPWDSIFGDSGPVYGDGDDVKRNENFVDKAMFIRRL